MGLECCATRIAELEAALERLRADEKRLDWLDSRKDLNLDLQASTGDWGIWDRESEDEWPPLRGSGPTLRAAIDAAMENKGD